MRPRGALARWVSGFLIAAVALGASAVVIPSAARYERPLGRVHFPVSCSPESQRSFDSATALLHSLRFTESEKAYAAIAESEPDCAMAYWGVAMSRLKYPVVILPPLDDASVARDSLRAATVSAASPRERAYLAAAERLFPEDSTADWNTRTFAYESAMETLATGYPEDREASIFYALALNMAAPVSDKSYAKRTKATELLLVALGDQPDHPGLAHYLTYCLNSASLPGAQYYPTASERTSMISGTRGLILTGLASLTLFCGLGMVITVATAPSSLAAESPAFGGPFALTAGDGRTVTDETFRGKWLLVYFGYTHCPDVCPTTLTDIAEALDQLGPLAARIQPLFITIDPERDSPQGMAEYVKAFDDRIIGLTGTPSAIAAAAKQYRVYYKKLPSESSDDYLMEHSAFVYVMGPDGRYVTLFSPQQGQKADRMAARLRQLMTESS